MRIIKEVVNAPRIHVLCPQKAPKSSVIGSGNGTFHPWCKGVESQLLMATDGAVAVIVGHDVGEGSPRGLNSSLVSKWIRLSLRQLHRRALEGADGIALGEANLYCIDPVPPGHRALK